MSAPNPNTYYSGDDHGTYQYVLLSDIINNFLLMYVDDDQIINNLKREKVIFHAKRGLQELTYDALREVKVIEVEVDPETLTWILPHDYVDYVRISWVDEEGNFHPLLKNETLAYGKAYLQDHEYNILFDDEGFPLEADSNSYDPTKLSPNNANYYPFLGYNYGTGDYLHCVSKDGRYGLETTLANKNGWFSILKREGVIKFSSIAGQRNIVIEYISDGLEYVDEENIKVHKFAEQTLYDYIRYMILSNKMNVQEYIVRRAKRKYIASLRNSKIRMNNIRYNELIQQVRGANKWIK